MRRILSELKVPWVKDMRHICVQYNDLKIMVTKAGRMVVHNYLGNENEPLRNFMAL